VEGMWRYGEHTGGAASARHTATGKSVGRTHHWRGERRVSGYRKFGGASPPPAGGPYGARRPKSQRGEHTAGVASGWRVATGKSTEQVYRQRGDRMARRDRKVDGASTPPARRADGWRGEWMACSDRKVRGASTPPARYADSTRAEGVRYGEQMDDSRLDYVGSLVRERLD
jgi:hypothetical protein